MASPCRNNRNRENVSVVVCCLQVGEQWHSGNKFYYDAERVLVSWVLQIEVRFHDHRLVGSLIDMTCAGYSRTDNCARRFFQREASDLAAFRAWSVEQSVTAQAFSLIEAFA